MKIRHQLDVPLFEEEASGLMQRIRDSRWTPVVVMTIITLATVRTAHKDVTINIYNQEREVKL